MKNWFVAAVLSILAVAANAQEEPQRLILGMVATCHTTEDAQQRLEEEFGEIPFLESQGVIELRTGELSNTRMRVYANPESLTTTITVDFADGVSCVVFMGDDLTPVVQGDNI